MGAADWLRGRPNRLHVLDFGSFQVGEGGRVIGIPGFLVATDAGEHVLIDAGFPSKYAADPDAAGRVDGLDGFGRLVRFSSENLLAAQLRRLGLDAGRIDLFVLTHTHVDHVGDLDGFGAAPVVLAEAERALARPLYWGERRPLAWVERDYRPIRADTGIGEGFDILLAPGHTPGQLAVALDLPRTGPVLIVSDAISRASEIDEGFPDAWDPDLALAQARRLMKTAAERGAFLIFGHAPDQWAALRKAPDFYD